MKIKVETTDNYAEKIIVEYTPYEWSVTSRAVKLLRNMSNCKEEADIFDQMLNTEPEFIESEDTAMKEKLGDVLGKIKSEIEQEYNRLKATRADETLELGTCLGLKMSLKIINKYKEGGT